MNINKQKLLAKLKLMLNEKAYFNYRQLQTQGKACDDLSFKAIFALLEKVIFNNPTVNCIIKGKTTDWDSLPKTKSLFNAPLNCGLPIGNLTSQLFSNVYLNDFDHYVKNELKITAYGRYVDDFYIFHTSKNELKNILYKCKTFLANEGLTVHPKKIYLQHYSKGFQFLGTFIKPHRIYIENTTANNFKRKVSHYQSLIANDRLEEKKVVEMRTVINSYLGFLQHYATYRLRTKTVLRYGGCFFLKHGYFSSDFKKITIYSK